jgi:mannosyltransferase
MPFLVGPIGPGDRDRWVDVGLALLVAGVALVVSMYQIGRLSLWWDEVYSLEIVRLGLRGILERARETDINMLGYYVPLWLWMKVSTADVWVRALSAAFAALAAAATFGLARTLFDRATALVAGLLLAVTPFMVQYGQEARGYSFAVLLAVVSTWALVIALRRPGPWRWAVYVATAALLPYAHPVMLGLYPVHVVVVLTAPRRPTWKAILPVVVSVGVLIAPALLLFASQSGAGLDWIPPTQAYDVWRLFERLLGAGTNGLLVPAPTVLTTTLLATAAVLAVIGGVHALRDPDRRWSGWLLLAWLIVPVVAVIVVSLAKPLFIHRYVLYVLPAMSILIALGATSFHRPAWRTVAAFTVIGLTLTATLGWYGHAPKPDWRSAAGWLLQRSTHDAVAAYLADDDYVMTYYARRAGLTDRLPRTVFESRGRDLGGVANELLEVARREALPNSDLWVIAPGDTFVAPEDDERLGPLGEVMRLAGWERIDGIILARYVPRS